MEIRSLGYFVDEDKDVIIFSESICPGHDEQPLGAIRHIGKKLLVSIKKL